jgi:GDP-4-dehydro-6-deoxy-D-mannose reductase
MAKILITGANGFVGKHLVKELLDSNYQVVAIGGSQIAPLEETPGVEYMTIDLSDADDTKRINFDGVSGVIHLAGLAAVGPSFDKPLEYINVNIGLEINLFEAALSQNLKPKFLSISSGTLYDPKADQPLSESSPVLPNSPYAVSKIGQEQMAHYYGTRGFESLIARPFNHIGPGQGLGLIVPDFAQQIVKIQNDEQSEMMVGNLEAQRDYTDVRDIVRAYRLLIEKGKSGEVYNICSGQPLSGQQILDGLSRAANVVPAVKQDPDKMRPSDTPLIVGNYDKLTADTGWRPEIALTKTFEDVIADWRESNKNY